MKRKSVILISLIMASIMLLYGCNSGDSSEKPANDISRPHDISFDYNDDDFHDKSDDTNLDGKYYLSLYEEQEPIKVFESMYLIDMPSAMEFTGSEVKLYDSAGGFYATCSYAIYDGFFNTVSYKGANVCYDTVPRPVNSEFKNGDGCFYLNYEKGDNVYNFKYSKQNILDGKYKVDSDLFKTELFPDNSMTQFEFKGNEVIVTRYDGREETYEYIIYGQRVILIKEEEWVLANVFQMYGYTDKHFYAKQYAHRDYYEFKRVD